MPKYSNRSKTELASCHSKLQDLFNEVIEYWDCSILEGHRDLERQEMLVSQGTSMTMNSFHLYEPSYAVDVAPFPINWSNREKFRDFSIFVKYVAKTMGIWVSWGGDWVNFKDMPHWQLEGEFDFGP